MKQIPMLFSTPMVQAVLDGRKTQTRRIVKVPISESEEYGFTFPVPKGLDQEAAFAYSRNLCKSSLFKMHCPYGKVGDVIWVRETWQPLPDGTVQMDTNLPYTYKTSWAEGGGSKMSYGGIWKPSIHMPKAAARIWLEVTDIKVERLNDISEQDAEREGIIKVGFNADVKPEYKDYCKTLYRIGQTQEWGLTPVGSFRSLWQSINGTDSWNANPWVWVVSFKILSTTGKPENL